MKRIAVLLSVAALSSNAHAAQSRYLDGNEILASFTGRTMLWEDYKTPDKPPAVVHYSPGNLISILYDGQIVPNNFVFDGDGSAICWRQKTVCRSFLYDGDQHVYVVNPNTPDDILAEVTRVTDDRNGSTFQKIAETENAPQPPAETAQAEPMPAPTPTERPRANSGPQMSARDVAIAKFVFGMLVGGASAGGDSTDDNDCIRNGLDQCKISEDLAHNIDHQQGRD